MVSTGETDLLAAFEAWMQSESTVRSAVLFGSHARPLGARASADQWSDIDLHVVTSSIDRIVEVDWNAVIRGAEFCMKVVRTATGGVQKITVLFTEGEADLVLVRVGQMRLAALAMALGLHRRFRFVANPLNTFATIMSGGYRFLKGEREWGALYSRVVSAMDGYRIGDDEARQMADSFLCDLLWVLQKVERGELVAAQRILHRALLETNVVLLHELRLRRSETTFQQARRVEQLVSSAQLAAVQVNARLERREIIAASVGARNGLVTLMRELVPAWGVPSAMERLLARYLPKPAT